MDLPLYRDVYGTSYTEGWIPMLSLATIEQPWANNDPDHSCAPEAKFDLIPYFSPKHNCWTWCLHNPAVGIYAFPSMIPKNQVGRARSTIEIHPANYEWQLLGCVAPGTTRGTAPNPNTGVVEPCVWNSKVAFDKIVALLAPDGDIEHATGHTLTITVAANVTGTTTGGYIFE